jgi:hypothetical protein
VFHNGVLLTSKNEFGRAASLQILWDILKRIGISSPLRLEKEAGPVAQAVECLPSKYDILSSNSSIIKKKKD